MPRRKTLMAECGHCNIHFLTDPVQPHRFCSHECSEKASVKSVATKLRDGVLDRPEIGCWVWTKAKSTAGYGKFGHFGVTHAVHRAAWEQAHGPIPDGLLVLHHCDNPPCVRTDPDARWPDGHLFLGTNKDNADDKVAKGRARGGGSHGENHARAKLTSDQVSLIRALPAGSNLALAARQLGVTRQCVRGIYIGRERTRG